MTERAIVWCCRQCGRIAPSRLAVGSESCYLHAVQVYEDSIQRDAKGVIVSVQNVEYAKPGPGAVTKR